MRRLDLISSVIILGLTGVALFWLIPNHVSSQHDKGDLPPNLIPILSAAVLGITGLLIGISAWRQKEKDSDEAKANEAGEILGFGIRDLISLAILLAASVTYWLLLRYVGFEVASGALIAAGIWYGGLRNIWIIAGSAIVIPLLLSQLAWYTLNIKLP